jgi:hypothetical protein
MPVQTRVESIDKPGMEGGGGIYTYSAGCQAPRWIRELDLGVRSVSLGKMAARKAAVAFLKKPSRIWDGMAHGHPPTALRRCGRQRARSESSVA